VGLRRASPKRNAMCVLVGEQPGSNFWTGQWPQRKRQYSLRELNLFSIPKWEPFSRATKARGSNENSSSRCALREILPNLLCFGRMNQSIGQETKPMIHANWGLSVKQTKAAPTKRRPGKLRRWESAKGYSRKFCGSRQGEL
jgi:hypothetical protein